MLKNDILELNKIIVNNRVFELLKAILNIFNPFKILKMNSFEIRHSNVLAWLLDPKGNHSLGDKVLKKILSEVILNGESINIKKYPMEIYSVDFQDTEIYREWNHIDILAVSEKNKIILIIENKIYSDEHDNKLERYLEIVNRKYEGYDIIPVFLTLTGNKAVSTDKWEFFDYNSIYSILMDITNLYKDNINNKIVDFIQYYLKLWRS